MDLLQEYQEFVRQTANPIELPRDRILKGVLGLTSEAGEVSGVFEKVYYQEHELDYSKAVKEMGDVIWYLTYLADQLGTNLEELIVRNMLKLRERYPKDVFDADDSIARVDGG